MMGIGLGGLCVFGFGVGVINAVIAEKLDSWMNTFRLLSTPLLWLSGIFYSLESIPEDFRKFLVWNPIIHGVEYVRMGYFQNYRDTHVDIAYLYGLGLVLVFVGLAAERAIRLR